MPGRFLEIPVFLGDYFIMPHPVYADDQILMADIIIIIIIIINVLIKVTK